MPAKLCLVSVVDVAGTRHTAEVQAESLYEAACRGLAALRNAGWTPYNALNGRLEIECRAPVVRHSIQVHKLEAWLDRSGEVGPKDFLAKKRLKDLLYARPKKKSG